MAWMTLVFISIHRLEIDGGLARRQCDLDGGEAGDVAALVLGDHEGSGIVLGSVDAEAGGDVELGLIGPFDRLRQVL